MMTARACMGRSDIPSRLPQPLLPAAVLQAVRQPAKVPVCVTAKVEVKLRDGNLHLPPHRLPEIGHDPHQLQSGSLVRADVSEVRAQQQFFVILAEALIGAKVSQIEEDVAHSRVLPIQYANPAVIHKVLVEQIVVTD